jgi:hypothetical protein
MALKTISGTRARRNARIAQMAGLALAVSATALWALQVPGLQGPLPQKPEVTDAGGQPVDAGTGTQAAPLDSETVAATAERWELAAQFERTEEVKPEGPTAPATAPATGEWRYISFVREKDRMLAVLSRNGKMKVLAPGREWEYDAANRGKAKLVSVDEHKAVIEDGSVRKEIPRGERTGSLVQWTRMAPNTPGAGAMGAAGAMEGQIGAKGVDQSQAQRFREQMRHREALRAKGTAIPPHMLNELGLTEEQVAKMSPDELDQVQAKYQAQMRQRGVDTETATQEKVDGDGSIN